MGEETSRSKGGRCSRDVQAGGGASWRCAEAPDRANGGRKKGGLGGGEEEVAVAGGGAGHEAGLDAGGVLPLPPFG